MARLCGRAFLARVFGEFEEKKRESGMNQTQCQTQWKMNSRIGRLYLVSSEKGLCGVLWEKQMAAPMTATLSGTSPAIRTLSTAVEQLEEYFDGRRRSFDLPLDIRG